jgi:hypothetical protein
MPEEEEPSLTPPPVIPPPHQLIDLSTLRTFKAYPTAEDALLGELLLVATAMIESYCEKPLVQVDLVKRYGKFKGVQLILDNFPIDDLVLTDGDTVLEDYIEYKDTGIVSFLSTLDAQDLTAEYKAGYLVTPSDLAFACFLLVDNLRQKVKLGDVKSANFGAGSPVVQYTPDWSMPMTVKQILDSKYRKKRAMS